MNPINSISGNSGMSEQEQLARLVGNPDLEPVDTASLLDEGLRISLGGVSPDKVREMESEIRNSGDVVETSQLRKIASNKNSAIANNASMEKVLVALYDAREGMVEAFETCNVNSKTASILAGQINKLASCIRYVGGDIEEFEPLNHVSGLAAPDFYKNAQKVIETTIQCYSLGDVEDAKVLDNGKKITIVFTGTSGNRKYKVAGTITSDEWTGNEAIDYIYTPKSGQMSVKAFENGRWVNRNSSDKYKIVWELEESDIPETVETVEATETTNKTP